MKKFITFLWLSLYQVGDLEVPFWFDIYVQTKLFFSKVPQQKNYCMQSLATASRAAKISNVQQQTATELKMH